MRHRILRSAARATASLSAALLFPAAASAAAADDSPRAGAGGKRPRICLVLSGGGARGAAHVGVIKVLDELRVPIDCITGTSMGALVGAAFATGMSLPEMEQIIASMSVEKLFKEKPPRQELATRRKFDDYQNYFSPEIGTSGQGSLVGKGVISGVQLETVLRQLSKVTGYHRFDELPIPFRAVATDLVTGKAVVFSEGDIPNVMRASMSVPGAVAPAEFDGMMLVDGMLTQNLPVQAARDMGADVIIAVNVGTPLLNREQLTGILGVAGQMLSILTEQNVQASIASLKSTDVLISPELGDFSTGDFDNLATITPLGEDAARKATEQLARLSLPAGEYAALRKRQQFVAPPDLRPVDEIRFDKLQRVNVRSAQAVMATQVGRPIDPALLDADMRRLYGTGDFEHVNYRIIDEQGKRVLAVEAVEKSWGPDYLRLGVGLSSDFSGEVDFRLLLSYRKTWLNSLGAEWRTDVQLGNDNTLVSEFYQPLGATSHWFVAPRATLDRRHSYLYQSSDRIAAYTVEARSAGVDLGLQFHPIGEMRLGIEGGRISQELDTGPDALRPAFPELNQGGFVARLFLDQLDSVNFPRKGWGGSVRVFNSNAGLGADQSYTKWNSEATVAYSFGEHTLNAAYRAGGRIGADPLPPHDQFSWGGFLRQSGYATGQLNGQQLQYLRALYLHRIYRSGLLEGAYGGLAFELGRVGRPQVSGNPEGTLKSLALFVAMDSYVGPLYLGYGRAAGGTDRFYFYLGRPL